MTILNNKCLFVFQLYTLQLKLEDVNNPLAVQAEQQQQQQDTEAEAKVQKKTLPELCSMILTSLLQLQKEDKFISMLSIRKGKVGSKLENKIAKERLHYNNLFYFMMTDFAVEILAVLERYGIHNSTERSMDWLDSWLGIYRSKGHSYSHELLPRISKMVADSRRLFDPHSVG